MITLFDADGVQLKALPEARKDDDAGKVKRAKETLATVKKTLKEIVAVQKTRLYEAMCTRRAWRFEDWQAYLHEHPIVRLLCQRIVWQLDGRPGLTFRPLNDGTLSDAHERAVTPQVEELMRVAHGSTVTSQQQQEWLDHFNDYEVNPFLNQFNRPAYTLPDVLKEETELTEFQGYLLEAFQLRAQAFGFGYARGQAMDDCWFYSYEKSLPGLNITAVIEFSGNPLPEKNRLVALQSLSFREQVEQHEPLPSPISSPSAKSRRYCSANAGTTCACWPPTAPATTRSGRRRCA